VTSAALSLEQGRFARFEAIGWWDQERLRRARILVVGAGALGNEVIKNLALLGVGHLVVVDMDRIERSNLSRSALFRERDAGRPKADVAVAAARDLYPDLEARAIVGNVLGDVGLGVFRWADVVIGALDNREARVFVNQACAQVGRPWFDGGLDVLSGIARGFDPPGSACYECTMGQADWDLLNARRSCSLLARLAHSEGGTPTTPTSASIIGAIQAQEAVKRLHGRPGLVGRGFVYEGQEHGSYCVEYPISPDCPWHEDRVPIVACPQFGSDTPLGELWEFAARELGGLDAIDLSRELVEFLECPACHERRLIHAPQSAIDIEQASCGRCHSECVPSFTHSFGQRPDILTRTPRGIGLPTLDVLWARHGMRSLGLELSADRDAVAALETGMTDGGRA
jgi:adenylyltransferase/sulfurtransferase